VDATAADGTSLREGSGCLFARAGDSWSCRARHRRGTRFVVHDHEDRHDRKPVDTGSATGLRRHRDRRPQPLRRPGRPRARRSPGHRGRVELPGPSQLGVRPPSGRNRRPLGGERPRQAGLRHPGRRRRHPRSHHDRTALPPGAPAPGIPVDDGLTGFVCRNPRRMAALPPGWARWPADAAGRPQNVGSRCSRWPAAMRRSTGNSSKAPAGCRQQHRAQLSTKASSTRAPPPSSRWTSPADDRDEGHAEDRRAGTSSEQGRYIGRPMRPSTESSRSRKVR
jgi:hypothetical protein